jgi:site-specific DNA-methyltransferase (adenine-specific)
MTRLLVGDCREVLPSLDAGSIASVVTDPPYHLTGATRFGKTRSTRGFMNKEWDGGDVAFQPDTWEAVARVTRPGGYLLAFGGTRTYHRLACAIEDGGWEIVDCLAWLYGQGFPKHDSKLKPAFEPIVMARTPGPVHALSIDACRIGWDAKSLAKDTARRQTPRNDITNGRYIGGTSGGYTEGDPQSPTGRWPANVVLDDEAAAVLDEQSGKLKSGANPKTRNTPKFDGVYNGWPTGTEINARRETNSGGASRFFYCAKASRSERDAGLDGVEKKPLHWSSGDANPGSFQAPGTDKTARNNHPTVKPITLMRWLVRLVTPIGGTVLDPFMGSGSTGAACGLEGFGFVGTELSAEYLEIARRRIAHWTQTHLFEVAV